MSDHGDDLAGTICAATNCLEEAGVLATATLTLPALVGATPQDDPVVLAIPLCVERHAHLLRMGADACEFDSRLT